MSLKEEIVESCKVCKGRGYSEEGVVCACLLKFRAYNRLLNAGFFRNSLDLVSSETYEIPEMEYGKEFIDFFLKNPEFVEKRGLSLFIWSKEKGRGKTTLAHYLLYKALLLFSDSDNYSTNRTYCFQTSFDMFEKFYSFEAECFWKNTWYVLDDLGNEDGSGKKKVKLISALQKILQYRRNSQLPTIITSNYSPDALSNKYDLELDSLLEIKPDGHLGGLSFREVNIGGAEDLRLLEEFSQWPKDEKE